MCLSYVVILTKDDHPKNESPKKSVRIPRRRLSGVPQRDGRSVRCIVTIVYELGMMLGAEDWVAGPDVYMTTRELGNVGGKSVCWVGSRSNTAGKRVRKQKGWLSLA